MNGLSKESVTWTDVDETSHEQRIDNFLLKRLKGVPKSHIYRILRSGEVRVNSRRVGAAYRLQTGDRVRIPPVRLSSRVRPLPTRAEPMPVGVLFEDEALLVIDKPAGAAVHGGSGVSQGVIERLRAACPQARFLELVHRLDRETSGVLLLAKKRSALTALHKALREGRVEKHYLALVLGSWRDGKQVVTLPLQKFLTHAGERRVAVDEAGAQAKTVFRLERRFVGFSLLEAELKTGRTHQIRVHLSYLGFPIAGDDKYGDFAANKVLAKRGLKRMFLHAACVAFRHPLSGERLVVTSPLPQELQDFVCSLEAQAREQA